MAMTGRPLLLLTSSALPQRLSIWAREISTTWTQQGGGISEGKAARGGISISEGRQQGGGISEGKAGYQRGKLQGGGYQGKAA